MNDPGIISTIKVRSDSVYNVSKNWYVWRTCTNANEGANMEGDVHVIRKCKERMIRRDCPSAFFPKTDKMRI